MRVNILADSTIQFTPVSVTELDISKELSIYPNPVTNFIEYDLTGNTKSQNIKLEIFNLEGMLIKRFEQKDTKDKLPIENLESGSYLLKISEKDKVIATRKFLKE